jgi:hypothetical protein
MPRFKVNVEDSSYQVDAPDERTAWAWANAEHRKLEKSAQQEEVAKMREGSALERFGRGAGSSLENIGYGLKGLVTDLSPEDKREIAINKAFLEGEKGEGIRAENIGAFAADIGSFLVPGGAAIKAARALPLAAKLASKAPVLAPLAGEAALGAGLSAAYAPEDRGTAATLGGIGGAAGYGIGRAASRVAGGLVRPSEQAKELQRKGVEDLTIGQAADQDTLVGKIIRRTEEGAQSLPIAGRAISKARERADDQFAKAAMNRAVPPGGKPVEGPSREAFAQLKKDFDKAYSVLDDVELPARDVNRYLGKQISDIIEDPAKEMSKAAKRDIERFLKDGFYDKFTFKDVGPDQKSSSLIGPAQKYRVIDSITGKKFKKFESDLNAKIRGLINRQFRTADEQAKLDSYLQIDEALTQYRNLNVPTDVATQLKQTDAAYANFKTLERASSYIAAAGGKFTPAQLGRAVRALTPQSRFARREGLLQDLTDPASTVLKPMMPDSGTAERAFQIGALGGTVANPMVGIPALAGTTLAAAGLYSRPMQRFLLGGGSRQQAIAEALRGASPYLGFTGAYAGSELAQ